MKNPRPAGRLTGTRIRERRLAIGMRQVDLAGQVEISPAYLNLIEHNKRRIGGKILTALARALRIEPGELREGAEAALLGLMNAAANRYPGAKAEQTHIDEMAGRYPGWANVITAQHSRIRELERVVEALSDRLTHDPHLAAMLHEVVSSVTAIRSAVTILTEEEIDPDWQARFLRNVAEDSARLTTSAQGLVGFLEAGTEDKDAHISPREAVTDFLAEKHWVFDTLETAASGDVQEVMRESGDALSQPAQDLAKEWLRQYQRDAQALPKQALFKAWQDTNGDPMQCATLFQVPLAMVLRRLASIIRLSDDNSNLGLVVCDGTGTLTTRKEIPGFSVPRFGASCPRWPLYQALTQPARPVMARVKTPGERGRVFQCFAISDVNYPEGMHGLPVHISTMLILPESEEDSHGGRVAAISIGPGCRVCPRANCPARREPSIMEIET